MRWAASSGECRPAPGVVKAQVACPPLSTMPLQQLVGACAKRRSRCDAPPCTHTAAADSTLERSATLYQVAQHGLCSWRAGWASQCMYWTMR